MVVLHAADPTAAPPLAILRATQLVSRSSACATPSPDPPRDPLLGRSRSCLSPRRLPTQSVLVIRAVEGCYGDVPAFLLLLVPLCSNSAVLPSDLSLLVSSFFSIVLSILLPYYFSRNVLASAAREIPFSEKVELRHYPSLSTSPLEVPQRGIGDRQGQSKKEMPRTVLLTLVLPIHFFPYRHFPV